MSSIAATIARLSALGQDLASAPAAGIGGTRLTELTEFGDNPGSLRGWIYAPGDLPPGAPLVVVLHGCTQSAAGYDHGSGWSRLAEEQGFAVLFPEQQRANNANLCFNWFRPEDARRDAGEALSIRRMIAAAVARHAIDPARIYITGLSAGGAMTSVMLAAYPELFAGGAIIAGLPYGVASDVPQALERMRGRGLADEAALAGLVRRASRHAGPWPTVSVWHGDADATVNQANAEAILSQWRAVHGIGSTEATGEKTASYARRVWRDAAGREMVEDYRIFGMGHGTPIATTGTDACGATGPHFLDMGVPSTRRIATSWGLLSPQRAQAPAPARVAPLPATPAKQREPAAAPAFIPRGVEQTIVKALRQAGLLR